MSCCVQPKGDWILLADYIWLVLRNSRSREPGKGQKVLMIAIVAVFIIGCLGLLLLKALRLGGQILTLAVVVLLLCTWLLDLRNRKRLRGKI